MHDGGLTPGRGPKFPGGGRLRNAWHSMVAMPPLTTGPLPDDEVFVVTGKGAAELKAAGTSLSAAELQVLVLLDGFSSVAQIAHHAPRLSRADLTLRSASFSPAA